ncbi:hypothetical protein D5086_007952 [Populus alba]|uniref:Uncharacterized protein n=1 Tax=Populus alba TaxID=43335 RepID=A0ACC4CEA0_POPAL
MEWESPPSILVTRNPNWSQRSGTGTGCVKGRCWSVYGSRKILLGKKDFILSGRKKKKRRKKKKKKEERKRKEEERKRGSLGRRGCGCCDEVVQPVVAAVELEEDGVGFLLQRKKEEQEKSAEIGRKCWFLADFGPEFF